MSIDSHTQLPKQILQHFRDPESSLVWYLNLTDGRIHRTSPKKLGTITDYYSADMEQYLCKTVESDLGSFWSEIADFAKLGLFAAHPVNLGSRCTVFMNSSVKQAQKDGASVEDISAGLSISIVKNAVYKVIRAASADDLGKHIVVQGGTFHDDAVLRAFEQELGRDVTRPTIAGIMGAFGAALAVRDLHLERSSLLSPDALQSFTHSAKPVTCNLCTNHCSLTVNSFDGGRKFISGNRCSRPLGKEKVEMPDLMHYKYQKLRALHGKGNGTGVRGRIGIPFGLNMYENLPFWYAFFTHLNFEVVLSPESSRKLYLKGQHTIPSDTVCYPAKLLHGHVEALVEDGVDAIWYPCMSYNNVIRNIVRVKCMCRISCCKHYIVRDINKRIDRTHSYFPDSILHFIRRRFYSHA